MESDIWGKGLCWLMQDGKGGKGAGAGLGAQLGREIYDPEDRLIVEMMWP